MSSCDILFANTDINEKFFCDEVTRDLKLNTLFDDDDLEYRFSLS